MTITSAAQKLTPPEVSRLWGVSLPTVFRWIKSGELKAINMAVRVGGRRRYLIDRDDLAEFERSRRVQPAGGNQ